MTTRLRVQRTAPGDWRAVLHLDGRRERTAYVGTFPTWSAAISEGCVAGRLQAAGISWTPHVVQLAADLGPEEWAELTGDGTGEALPPLPDDAYTPGAVDLEELPVDAVGRSLPGSLTFGQWQDEREGYGYP